MFRFELGQLVKDKITGFKGIVICQSKYLTGCNRYSLQSQKLDKGKPADWVAFDEDQLDAVNKKVEIRKEQRGGPVRFEAEQR